MSVVNCIWLKNAYYYHDKTVYVAAKYRRWCCVSISTASAPHRTTTTIYFEVVSTMYTDGADEAVSRASRGAAAPRVPTLPRPFLEVEDLKWPDHEA